MNNSVDIIRTFMTNNGLRYLLVNSTNQFLVEYNLLEKNSRYKVTEFSGSTGEALVTLDNIYLFVDGRYHIQADMEVNHDIITVVKLQSGCSFLSELSEIIPKSETLGVFSKKVSQQKLENILKFCNVKLLPDDPLDFDCKEQSFNNNVNLDISLTGLSVDDKIKQILTDFGSEDWLYITDLDEVSYLFNMRNFSEPNSAKIVAKALISKKHSKLFYENEQDNLYNFLKNIKGKVFVDKSSINAFDYSLLNSPYNLSINPVKEMKSVKNQSEIKHLKHAFEITDKTLYAIREYIDSSDNISEYDISQRLKQEFFNNGAKGLSFNPIVAINENSALAHYSKASKTKLLKEGDLILIDCGAYFEGGLATDITRVFVKGTPSVLHKKIYTLVLKTFLNAFNYKIVENSTGYQIDSMVHKMFENMDTEGFIFNHGLGHGIGINVHEYPPNLSQNEIAKVKMKDGMCFSIEPGLYKQGYFGVRLENSCYIENSKICSFVNMCYEAKLIDYELLDEREKSWLKEFEDK